MAKSAPLTEMADSELFKRLDQNKAKLFNLRFQLATGQLDNSVVLEWSTPPEDYLVVEIRWKNTADPDWLAWGVADGSTVAVIAPLTEGQQYEFQIRFRSDVTDRVGDWTASEVVTINFHNEIGAGSGDVIGAGGSNTLGGGFPP